VSGEPPPAPRSATPGQAAASGASAGFAREPSRIVASPDGVPIALFETGVAARATDHPTVILVHGTTADHTTFRALAPVLGLTRHVVAIDRRGRGASGDARRGDYGIEREYEDLAAVAQSIATVGGRPVDVLGHSYGGRVALGASLRSDAIRRVIVYEGAPPAPGRPYRPVGIERRIRAHLAHGNPDAALEAFFSEIVGLDDEALAAYRANPVWPVRVAAAHTVLRELDAEGSSAASIEALGGVAIPVLLVLGTASRAPFAAATEALAARLPRAIVISIDGAAHAAHHTHPQAFAKAVAAFLDT